jgi:hypothetical protein
VNHLGLLFDRACDGHALVLGATLASYALRGCSRALPGGLETVLASGSYPAAGGGHRLLTAVRGHLGDTRDEQSGWSERERSDGGEEITGRSL